MSNIGHQCKESLLLSDWSQCFLQVTWTESFIKSLLHTNYKGPDIGKTQIFNVMYCGPSLLAFKSQFTENIGRRIQFF